MKLTMGIVHPGVGCNISKSLGRVSIRVLLVAIPLPVQVYCARRFIGSILQELPNFKLG